MKKRTLVTYCIFFSLLMGFWVGGTLSEAVNAQETPIPAASPAASDGTVPVDTVFLKPQQPEKITKLLKLYQDQVEQYRKLENEYKVAKGQFFNLNTLQSLEKAVVTTRQTLVSRDEVLITYCELLHASLEETEGVEVSQKSSALKSLEDQINSLKDHKKKSEETTDREGMLARADEFDTVVAPLEVRTHTTRALISLGELQAVYDKATLLFGEIKLFHREKTVSGIKQQERERAYREVDRALEVTGTRLAAIKDAIGAKEEITASRYDSVLGKEMSAVYAQNSQIIEFLNELVLELT